MRSNVIKYVQNHPLQEVEAGYLRLHANESPFNSPDNRYPDSSLQRLKERWGRHEGIPPQCCHLCNGTEEAFDLTLRIFCRPETDSLLVMSPSRSIYARRAELNEVPYGEVPLKEGTFDLNIDSVLERVHPSTKMIVVCNPNSPTANSMNLEDIATMAELFNGIVVVDESYVEFSPAHSCLSLLNRYDNVVIIRSFSHAWAAASIRLSVVVAHPSLIRYFDRMGMSHPVSKLTADYAERLVSRRLDMDKWVRQIIDERNKVALALASLPVCEKVYPSETNFLLVKMKHCKEVVAHLLDNHIAVAHCSNHPRLTNCVRITIALPAQNSRMLGALRRYCELHKMLQKA